MTNNIGMFKQRQGYPSNNLLFWLLVIALVVRTSEMGMEDSTKSTVVKLLYGLAILLMLYNVVIYPQYRVFFITRFIPFAFVFYLLTRLAAHLAKEPFNMNMYDACINACNEGCPNWNKRAMTRCWACCRGNPVYLNRCVVDCSQA